ncbi:MAG TPA: GAF domain-containing sensor histidine kinase, partial [Deinococcales bacterium]|nr:GAF domain-containing sensor histidine kinase [Deinococcales bacterium]
LRRLYLQLAESHARLAAVQDVTRRVSEVSGLDDVLQAAATGMVEAVGATAGAIVLESGLARGANLPSPIPAEVLDLEPLRSAHGSLERPSAWEGASARLSVPLRWGDRFLGAVHAYFGPLPPQSSRDLLEIISGEVAAAIEAAEHRARDWVALHEVDRSIRAETNLERLLTQVLSRMRARVPAPIAGVYLLDEHGRLLLTFGEVAPGVPARAGMAGAFAREVGERRTPCLDNDLLRRSCAPEPDPLDALLENARSSIGLPMVAESELVGVIVLANDQAGQFDARDLPFLGLLASQATLAVRNARAYQYSEELAIMEERSRIAREIHDGVAQSLAFTALKLDLTTRLLTTDPEKVQGELAQASGTLREQIREVRRSVFALRPINLDRLGFLETMRRYVADFGEQNSVRTSLEIEGEPHLPSQDELALFRILQEALNNVAKHSGARHAWVSLSATSSRVELSIRDDGKGFNIASLTGRVSTAGGLGLSQMRERLQAKGGSFEFSSAVGRGTRVTASLPVT